MGAVVRGRGTRYGLPGGLIRGRTYLLGSNGLLGSLVQLLNRLLVVAEILLAAN